MFFTIKSLETITPNTVKAILVARQKFEFIAGQYIELQIKPHFSKYYSIANAPNADDLIELHIQARLNADVIDLLNVRFKSNGVVDIKGPFGTFNLKQDWHHQILFIASGVGLTPIKSIIENSYLHKRLPKTYLYWGVKSEVDLYLHEEILHWANHFHDFTYVPVLSNPDKIWKGKTGNILDVVKNSKHVLKKCLVYACGSQNFVEDVFKILVDNGLPPTQFVSDYHDNTIINT